MPDAEVRRHAEAETGLPHRRARREDDEVSRLEAGGEQVELLVPGRDTGDLGARLVEVRDALEAVLEEHLDVREVARHLLLAELEHDLLGAVDEVGDLTLALLSEPHDLLARADEAAQRRHLLDDARVVLDVRGRRDERGELGHPRLPSCSFELGPLVELVGQRDRVDGLALRPQRERGAVDLRVALAVEVGRVEDLAHRPDGDGREQHRAQHRLLGLEVLRRNDGAQALSDPFEVAA